MAQELKIMVVDDDEMFRMVLTTLFADHGEVITAKGGFEAIELLKKTPVQIVFCDINMPKGTGLELLDWVQASDQRATCSVVLVTGRVTMTPEESAGRGAFAVVEKPFRMKLLLEILEKLKTSKAA